MVSINYPIFAYFLRKRKEKFSSAILIALNQKEE